MVRAGAIVVGLLLALALAGCGSGAGGGQPAGTCLPAAPSGAVGALPDVALACFDGSGSVHIGQIRRPAIVNLWASWCEPCRAELPAFQRLAERAGGRLAVIGVNTSDNRGGAEAVIDDLGLTFPMLSDDRKELLGAVGRTALPATLFVSADGRIAHVYNGDALDDAALAELVSRHLGVLS